MITKCKLFDALFNCETTVKTNRNTTRIMITEQYEMLSFLCLLPYIQVIVVTDAQIIIHIYFVQITYVSGKCR